MKASLVVCTKNRASRLALFLKPLEAMDWSCCELVMVDNASSDDTVKVLTEWSQNRPWVKIVQEPGKGQGIARNTGWKAACGDVVVFIDDDCYAAPDLMARHVQLYAGYERVGWISGRVLLHDPLDAPITIQENNFAVYYHHARFLQTGAVHGANLSLRREVLESIGGFDSRAGAGAEFFCDDIDVVARASFAGWDGLYHPAPVVRHHHGRRGAEAIQRLDEVYLAGRGHYFAKCLWNPKMCRAYVFAVLKHWIRQPLRVTLVEWKAMLQWWKTADR